MGRCFVCLMRSITRLTAGPTVVLLLTAIFFVHSTLAIGAEPFQDRFVWVFGWNLNRETDVAEIAQVLDVSARHELNGAVMSLGLDTLCKRSPEYVHRLDQVHQACQRHELEFIPAIFSVGYGGAVLTHDRNLAEGLPVDSATFVAAGQEARFVPDSDASWKNGGFELVKGDFTGSWDHVPKDLTIAVWGGEPREKSLQLFAENGFRTLVACYYDANDLKDVRGWVRLAHQSPNVRGLMYTPWQKKYALLGEFGDMLQKGE